MYGSTEEIATAFKARRTYYRMYSIERRLLLMFLYVLSSLYGQTQSTGTFGREFYIGILKTFDGSTSEFSLLITSNTFGTATIYIPHLGINVTRSFNQSLEYTISGDTMTKVNTTLERKGIHVTTDVDVSIVVNKHPGNTWEGFLAFPAKLLSAGYVVSSYTNKRTYGYQSNFLILSVYNNTDIEIHANGSIYSTSMNHLDTFLFRRFEDLSGAIVKSNKPVAIFSGHEAAAVPHSCGGEYIVEQLLPIEYFSREFIIPTTPPKSRYVFRVYSSVQNTSVAYSNTTSNKTVLLSDAGNFHEIISDNEPIYVAADKPVQCMLYGTCYQYNSDDIGNPFMSVIPSIKQFTNSYHFTVSSLATRFANYLAITARREYISGLRINGHPLRNLFRSYNISGYNERFSVNVYNISVGVYHLQHVNGNTFGAMQYGFYGNNAYGYVLGMNAVNDCGNLNAPINGQVEIANGTIVGSQAMYSCGSGYDLHGEQNRQCLADGHWNGSQPTCQIVDCGILNAPNNGKVDISHGTVFGSHAVYSCGSGYDLHGDQDRQCLADGHWNGTQPTCKPVECGILNAPNNGKVDISHGTVFGSQAVYRCVSGYDLHGERNRQCLAEGHWNGTQPTCKPVECGILNAPNNGKVDISHGTVFGSQAVYSCVSGYDLHGEQNRQCLAEGHWNGTQPTCKPVECGILNAPNNGKVDISHGTVFGSQAVYRCVSGYDLHGERNRQCLAEGHWNGTQPTCKPVECGILNAPNNGKVDISHGTVFGSQAVYSCVSGYDLHGEQNRQCLAEGHWNGTQPTCKPVGGRLSCIDCKDMTHLYLCDTVTTCSDGQVCYVETFRTTGGQVKYNSGCADSQQCSSWKRELHKRSSECVHCCSSQLCNVNGCGDQGLPAADLRGPLCYECAYVSSMEECKTVKLCAQNEVCSIEKYDWGGVYDHYTTKCHSKQCIPHKRSFTQYASSVRTARSTPVCQNCCSSDLCNTNCNVTSQGGNGVAIIG